MRSMEYSHSHGIDQAHITDATTKAEEPSKNEREVALEKINQLRLPDSKLIELKVYGLPTKIPANQSTL